MSTLNTAIDRAGSLAKGVIKAKLTGKLAVILLLAVLILIGGFMLIAAILSLFGGGEMGLPDSVGQINDVKYAKAINTAAKEYSMDPALIAAIIKAESNFNPKAGSHKGAKGLMQVMPVNADGADLSDPKENILRGTEIIAGHLENYGGNLDKALAAYNAGPGAVAKHDGVPPYPETENYVKKVKAYYEDYQAQVVDGNIQALPGGKLAVPAKTSITSSFGEKREGGKVHKGIDFSGKGDRSIFAAADGRVIEKKNLNGRSYGTLVVINHGGGIHTAYAHMDWKDIKVEVGQEVKRGQKIALIGNNGNSTGPHLHFEVRKNGQRVDPRPFLKK